MLAGSVTDSILHPNAEIASLSDAERAAVEGARRSKAGSERPGQTYLRIVVPRYGGPELLTIDRVPVVDPVPGEVRVRVLAAGVGYPDILMREGTYPGGPHPPFTPGYDLVGVADAVGPRVSSVTRGQRVAALTVFGSYAEMVWLREEELVPVPETLDAGEAVSVVLNYLTAYQLLHRSAHVERGERLLVQGAAGGVGSAALQLGALAGLELLGTASGDGLEVVREFGAEAIDYRHDDVAARVRSFGGADVVLDGLGGTVSLGSYRCLRRGGRLVMFGHHQTLVAGRKTLRSLIEFYLAGAVVLGAGLIPDGRRVKTYQVAKEKVRRRDWFRADLAVLFELLADRRIAPIIAGRFRLADARAAHEALGRGGVNGKLVLIC
jgi:NADPH:quinone reductase